MAARVLRIGVAGLGRAFSLMLPTFRRDPRVRLVAATDPRAEACERFATKRRPVSKSKVPAAACAVNSPSESPAATWTGRSAISERNAARHARPWTNSAG